MFGDELALSAIAISSATVGKGFSFFTLRKGRRS
jgi:hypothetical protein